ncbi:MAG: DNA alkylation repair protein [Pseudomonadota bacterium]
MAESKAFKDWFDRDAAKALAAQVHAVQHDFDRKRFATDAARGLDALEMMDRVRQFSAALRAHLPDDIPQALDILTRSLPPPLPNCDAVTDGWLQWPVGQFIADYGVEHIDAAMPAMHALTQRFSSEFAVRPFVQHFPERVFAQFAEWTGDASPHVRRWCSEGVRPRLPWGARLSALIKDPSPIFPILEALKDDDELYVRRSVANTLNDIAKDHPDRVLEVLERWREDASEGRDWVVKHAARSLLKQGDARALALLGFAKPKSLEANLTIAPKRVAIGSAATLSLNLASRSRRAQPLMIDFVVHYLLASGDTGPKVFKWTQQEIPAGGTLALTKKLPMKPTTIRVLRQGVHRVEVQVNGVRLAEASFRLVAA